MCHCLALGIIVSLFSSSLSGGFSLKIEIPKAQPSSFIYPTSLSTESTTTSSKSSSISLPLKIEIPKAQPSSFIYPTSLSTEAVWQKFLQDSTEAILGENSPLEAQLIFLGDIHTECWQKDWRGEIIKRYGRRAIVLCEGFQSKQVIPSRWVTSFSQKDALSIYGWDEMSIFNDKSALLIWDTFRKKYKESAPSPKWDSQDILAWKQAMLLIRKNCMHRNNKMIKTAKAFLKTLKEGQKLFVIAGSNHLIYKRLKYNVLDYFKGTKVCMILPKSLSKAPERDAEKYMQTLLSTQIVSSKVQKHKRKREN